MEFLETHTGKDAKAVWKNDIDVPVKEEATEESDDESEDEEDDKSKESTSKKRKRSFLPFLFFYFFLDCVLLSNFVLNSIFYNKIIFFTQNSSFIKFI